GDEKYRESFVEVGALAEKEEASIEAYVDKQKVVKGERIKITGQLNPPLSDQTILVKCVKGGQVLEYSAKTRGGKFTVSVELPSEGTWMITVYWNGSIDYYPCKTTLMVEVVSPPSLLEQVVEYKEIIVALVLVILVALVVLKARKKS
ncbi:MAG: hypothetical protein DRJ52_06640, partial [Thermoprotei archaeon]